MTSRILVTILLNILSLIFLPRDGFPWRVEAEARLSGTHQLLSKLAVDESLLGSCKNDVDNHCDYLVSIGLSDGLKEYLNWDNENYRIPDWVALGTELEDTGTIEQLIPTGKRPRYLNHFHNPLKDWDTAGLDDLLIFTGESSLVWAQDTQAQQSPYNPEGDWTWSTIREDYHRALTSETDVERQAAFARTFRGLGHQLHLLQDKAVPAHVRNDAHVMSTNDFGILTLEAWAQQEFGSLDKLELFLQGINISAFIPTGLLNNNIIHEKADVPITQLVDSNQYNETNPSVTSASISIGLAEFTNANFVSDDTIFTENRSTDDKHYFPYPKTTSTNLIDPLLPALRIAKDGISDQIIKVSKVRDGENIDNFLKASYLSDNIEVIGEYSLYSRSLYLDEDCHEDYAKKLIPRAVGYSAALLDYFFRGKITLKNYACETGLYVLENNSYEDMTGTFSLYYDDANDTRRLITSWTDLTIPANSESDILLFDFPVFFETVGIPAPKKPNTYMLVFEGTMGNEIGAVAGSMVVLDPFWCEEWVNGLKGSHDWVYTGLDIPEFPDNGELGFYLNGKWIGYQNWPGVGWVHNSTTLSGQLIKENHRYSSYSNTVQVNSNFLGLGYSLPNSGIPLEITSNTWVRLKIDEMSISPDIPRQNCNLNNNGSIGQNGQAGEQALELTLEDSEGTEIDISFTVEGQESFCLATPQHHCLQAIITPSQEFTLNIYETLKSHSINIVNPINLTGIYFVQQLASLCSIYPDQTQTMVVDYLMFVDGATH